MDDREVLWHQFELQTELFKFYLDVALKLAAFYYAITGGILSYFFAHPGPPLLKYALVLAIIFGVAFGALFLWGASLTINMHNELLRIAQELKLLTYPETRILKNLLRTLGGAFIITGCALIYFLSL